MRIQILELPDEWDGDKRSTPFVVIIGETTAEEVGPLRSALGPQGEAAQKIGAKAIWVLEGPIDLGAVEIAEIGTKIGDVFIGENGTIEGKTLNLGEAKAKILPQVDLRVFIEQIQRDVRQLAVVAGFLGDPLGTPEQQAMWRDQPTQEQIDETRQAFERGYYAPGAIVQTIGDDGIFTYRVAPSGRLNYESHLGKES